MYIRAALGGLEPRIEAGLAFGSHIGAGPGGLGPRFEGT